MRIVLVTVCSQSPFGCTNPLPPLPTQPKRRELLAAEAKLAQKHDNPANIGVGCDKHCICDIPGQIPCPAIVPLPNHMRGKFQRQVD